MTTSPESMLLPHLTICEVESRRCQEKPFSWWLKELSFSFNSREAHIWSITMSNLGFAGPNLEAAILRFSRELREGSCEVREAAEDRIRQLSGEISRETATGCEAAVSGSEHELALRLLLLCYYFRNRRESEHTTKARQRHILWIIQFAPESKIAGRPYSYLIEPEDQEAYQTGKALWLQQVDSYPENTRILENAAKFCWIPDWHISEHLLSRASRLEPNNGDWHKQLGNLYTLHGREESAFSAIYLEKGFREYQIAAQLESCVDEDDDDDLPFHRILGLIELATSAFAAKHCEEAREYATELLECIGPFDASEHTFPIGNAIHHGNLILGRLALNDGDVDRAKSYLLAAGRTPGSPQLDSFGPNMALAKELLERKEHSVVIEYFELCGKFWKLRSGRLEEWTNEVKAGNIPDFGAHLAY